MRNSIKYYLNKAAQHAAKFSGEYRNFYLAAVGTRSDGTTVIASNIATPVKCREVHAEKRLCKKLDVGSTVYVARVTRDGSWAMSRPCHACEKAMRSRGVRRVYYTIGPSEFGCVIFD